MDTQYKKIRPELTSDRGGCGCRHSAAPSIVERVSAGCLVGLAVDEVLMRCSVQKTGSTPKFTATPLHLWCSSGLCAICAYVR